MKEWLSEPQNISPLFPLPYTNLLSEVLQIYRRNGDWWQKSLKVRGFQTGSHGASDSKHASLQPQLLWDITWQRQQGRENLGAMAGRHWSAECARAVL